MKMYKCILAVILSVFLFAACEKETAGLSRITYYATFEMEGDEYMFIESNSTFTEPGVKAFEDETELPVDIKGTVNTAVPDIYTIFYSAKNSDGFSKTIARKVIVYDPTPSALESGLYKVSPLSNRTPLNSGPGKSGGAEYKSAPIIIIYQISSGEFYTTDFLGGYYEVGRGYGSRYAMTGTFLFNEEDNTIELAESYCEGFGDSLDDVVNGVLNPKTKTLTYTAQYAGTYDFNVIATKIN